MKFQIVSLLILSSMAATTQAAMNKWVDDKGQVHYGDEVPPQYLNQKRAVLNEQGVVVKTYKSQEQLEKEKKEQAAEESVKKARLIESKAQDLRDRVLLETFTSDRDIEIARVDRVSAIDSQIQLAESNIKEGERKMTEVNARISEIEKSGRTVPDNLFKQRDSVSRQLESNYKYVETKQDERKDLNKRFDDDQKRFRELKGLPPLPPAAAAPAAAPAAAATTAPTAAATTAPTAAATTAPAATAPKAAPAPAPKAAAPAAAPTPAR
ncbi:MAG: DUF4124 domain-containing protein [Gammaproteobacteria bacterium]|nr:DUF4124 domain-containing protein [Gammaproteobacteria bacterium]